MNYGADFNNLVHRVRLAALLVDMRPAQGTQACHLHSSCPCKDPCGVHSMKDAKGSSQVYKGALKRFAFERQVFQAFCSNSDDGVSGSASTCVHNTCVHNGYFRISRSYEKSGASPLRHTAGSGRGGRK